MNTAAPLITALVAIILAVSVLIRDHRDAVHKSYAAFAGTLALCFLSLFLKQAAEDFHFFQVMALLAALAMVPTCIDLHARIVPTAERPLRQLAPIVHGVVVVQALVVLVFSERLGLVVIWTNGLVVFGGIGRAAWIVWGATRSLDSALERERLIIGLGLGVGAGFLVMLEMLAGTLGASLGNIGIALPPFGTLALAPYLWFLGEVIVLVRLLDRHELVAKVGVMLTVSVVLTLIYGGLTSWIVPEAGQAAQLLNIFLASVLILNLYEPLQTRVEEVIMRAIMPERIMMARALADFRRNMGRILSPDDLSQQLLLALEDTQRVDCAAIYLWDEERRSYVLDRKVGMPQHPLIEAVPTGVFSEELVTHGEPLTVPQLRHRERRQSRKLSRRAQSCLEMMEAMSAQVALPLRAGRRLLGWVVCSDSVRTTGYSPSEVLLLRSLAGRAAVILQNSMSYGRIRERDRLAAMGEMAAGLAHEVRNPLGALKGAAQCLDVAGTKPEDRELLQVIVEEAERLDNVVAQFLDFARPLEAKLRPLDLRRLVEASLAVLRARGIPEGITIEFEAEADLPRAAADEAQIKQVLLNLLLNAIQAMNDEGLLHIKLGRASSKGQAQLEAEEGYAEEGRMEPRAEPPLELLVRDTGQGISPKDLSRLFMPFFTTKREGTGLGLAISKKIMDLHGGDIAVASTLGRGTRFSLRLPVMPPTEE